MQDFRFEAQAALKIAQDMNEAFTPFATTLAAYSDCIEKFLQIEHKIDADYRALESAYAELAIYHFNRHTSEHYENSRDNLIHAIQSLLKLQNTTDIDLRKFVQNYIDLADIFMYLHNKTQSDLAIDNAIKAFQCIKNKKAAEINLGDPKTNLQAFIIYFQKKTASKNYVKSVLFQNHTAIFSENQDEKNVLLSFGNVYIDEEKKVQQSLVGMIQAMSINTVKQPHTFFSNFSIQSPQDNDRRTLAKQYLSLTKEQLEKQKFINALKTYQQALTALKDIQQKSSEDTNYIQAIHEQIEQVKSLQKQTKGSTQTQNICSFTEHNGFQQNPVSNFNLFGNQQVQSTIDIVECDIEDIGMNIEYK